MNVTEQWQGATGGDERDDLIERYAVLVYETVARFARTLPATIAADDLIADGMLGLIRAIDDCGPCGEEEFCRVARMQIRDGILEALASRMLAGEKSLAPHRAGRRYEELHEVLVERLDEQQRTVLRLHYRDGLGIKEIALALGMELVGARRCYENLIDNLRAALTGARGAETLRKEMAV